MNLDVEPENLYTVLKSLRELLRDNILPRLTDLEEQVRLLDRTNFILGQLKDKKKVLDDLLSDKNQTKH